MSKEFLRILFFLTGAVIGFLAGNYLGLFGGILGEFGEPFSEARLKVAAQNAIVFGLLSWILGYVATKKQ